MKLKFTRNVVIATLVALAIGLIFLVSWSFGDHTKIFNDVIENHSYGAEVSYGWIHMALNTVLVFACLAWLIFFIWEISEDEGSRPFEFLYENDEDRKYRKNRRGYNDSNDNKKEEKPVVEFNWKKWLRYALLFLVLFYGFKLGKVIYKDSVFMYNTSKKYHNTYQQKVEEKQGFYDKLWKTYLQKEKITNINKETFLQVTKIIMENRKDGQNITWKWVHENQQIPYEQFTVFYADLSDFIASQREGYFNIEKTCQTIANQNNTLLDTFPNNVYNRMLKLQRINFEYGFLSDSTDNVFASKKENLK